jgi:hypothetical protein
MNALLAFSLREKVPKADQGKILDEAIDPWRALPSSGADAPPSARLGAGLDPGGRREQP